MKLASLLNPRLISVRKSYGSRTEMIEGLIAEIYRAENPPVGIEETRKAIFDREALGGTRFPTGIAIPHARFDGYEDLLIAVAVPSSPVPDSPVPIRMMVLMLTSKTGTTLYLNTLGAFLKISQNEQLYRRLCDAPSGSDLIETLRTENIEVKKELTVEDVMSTTFPSLTVENSVKDAADLFYKNRTSYLPVVDGRGVLLGELTVLDLFRIGMPDYASKIGSLKFLKSFEPFDTLLRDESTILLGTVMKKPSITIEEDAPVVEAILKFTQSNRRHIPVVKEGRIIGVVNYMDILQKVLRA